MVAPQTFKFPFDNEYKKFLEKLRAEGTTSPIIEERLAMLDYNETEGSGVTGICVLCESHAAIHTFLRKTTLSCQFVYTPANHLTQTRL